MRCNWRLYLSDLAKPFRESLEAGSCPPLQRLTRWVEIFKAVLKNQRLRNVLGFTAWAAIYQLWKLDSRVKLGHCWFPGRVSCAKAKIYEARGRRGAHGKCYTKPHLNQGFSPITLRPWFSSTYLISDATILNHDSQCQILSFIFSLKKEIARTLILFPSIRKTILFLFFHLFT